MADGDRTVVTANGTVGGLTVHREVTVPSTGNEDFARTVDTFTNSTNASITRTVQFIANLGSDAATRIFATSDGNATWEVGDQWIGTDDVIDGSGTPATIHYIHGSLGLTPVSVNVVGDNLVWTYNLTVNAGETVRLAYFTIVGATEAAAEAAATALVTPSGFNGQAAAFLSTDEVGSVVNFSWPDTTPPAVTLTVPALTNNAQPPVIVTATDDISGVPDGTTVFVDVDTNNDGTFTDPGEAGYLTGVLSGGTVTLAPSVSLA